MADNGKAADDDFFGGGFEDQSTPEIDGWYKPEIGYDKTKKLGQIVQGKIVGRIVIEDDNGDRDVVIVKVRQPVKAQDPEDKDKTIELKLGDCIGVGIRYNLRGLLEYVEHRGEVKFQATEKVNLKGGRTMWKFRYAGKGKKSAPPAPAKTGEPKSEGGELPF